MITKSPPMFVNGVSLDTYNRHWDLFLVAERVAEDHFPPSFFFPLANLRKRIRLRTDIFKELVKARERQ